MSNVLISHAGRDRAWAEWVSSVLSAVGHEVLMDTWDWATGDDFVGRMSQSLGIADQVVALISQAYLEREAYTTEEWAAVVADPLSSRLVPVRVEDVRLPPALRAFVTVDLFEHREVDARQVLLAAVGGHRKPPPLPRFPESEGEGPRLPGTLPPVWNVPTRGPAFTGRDAVLSQLRGRLGSRPGPVILTGISGVGKTALAIEYAHRFSASYDLVWWIDAERPELIGEQLVMLAVQLDLVIETHMIAVAVRAARTYLRTHRSWLLIFDFAESPEDLAPWLPEGPGDVLITSRNPAWSAIGSTSEIDTFTDAEAAAFLHTQLPQLTAEETARLAATLGGLPLALWQAASLLAETGMPAVEYLAELDRRTTELLDMNRPVGYRTSLAATVDISMGRLVGENPAAAMLLRLCAFLAPEPIPLSLFSDAPDDLFPEPLASVARTPLALRRAVSRTTALGLSRVDKDEIQLHRLLQGVLRGLDQEPDRMRWLAEEMLVAGGLSDPQIPDGWSAWARLLPHLLAIGPDSSDNRRLCRKACQAAWYLLRRGDATVAQSFARELFLTWRERFGPEDLLTLYAAQILAEALRDLHRYVEALDIDRTTQEAWLGMAGEDDPATLSVTHNLGIDLRGTGRSEDAREIHEHVHRRRRVVYGDADPRTLASLHQLGLDWVALGQPQTAERLLSMAADGLRAALGADHLLTLEAEHNSAANMLRMGYAEEARKLQETVLARYRRLLGEEHPYALTATEGLAAILHELGATQAAADMDLGTLERRRRLLGDDHPDTVRSEATMRARETAPPPRPPRAGGSDS